jgi:isocitrate/isopropylmalate dehydrogenase
MKKKNVRPKGVLNEDRVQVDERIVDACAMQLVLNPWQRLNRNGF